MWSIGVAIVVGLRDFPGFLVSILLLWFFQGSYCVFACTHDKKFAAQPANHYRYSPSIKEGQQWRCSWRHSGFDGIGT